MAINGSLEDVSVSDVLQFVSLGKRTGTLFLERDGATASLGFVDGHLTSAQAPGMPALGEILVASGKLSAEALAAAVAAQELSGQVRRLLGASLMERGLISPADLRAAVRSQIGKAVGEVVRWERGSFDFILGDVDPGSDVRGGQALDTEHVLLEAARIFDEERRSCAVAEPGASPEPRVPFQASADGLSLADLEVPSLILGSRDHGLAEMLRGELGELAALEMVPPEALSGRARGAWRADLVILDDRQHDFAESQIRAIAAAFGEPSLVAIVGREWHDPPIPADEEMGVTRADPSTIVAWARKEIGCRRSTWHAPVRPGHTVVARLSRGLRELRSGLLSATVALHLMQVISEAFERGVLMVLSGGLLVTAGAFGLGQQGIPLATCLRGYQLAPSRRDALGRCALGCGAAVLSWADARLPLALASVLGPPAADQVVTLPILGAKEVVAVVYADNGIRADVIRDLTLVELAAAQVGMAFENEILRVRAGRLRGSDSAKRLAAASASAGS